MLVQLLGSTLIVRLLLLCSSIDKKPWTYAKRMRFAGENDQNKPQRSSWFLEDHVGKCCLSWGGPRAGRVPQPLWQLASP